MQTVSCPSCGDPLGDACGYCAHCGRAAHAPGVVRPPAAEENASLEWVGAGPTDRLSARGLYTPGETPQEDVGTSQTLTLAQQTPTELAESTLNLKRMRQGARERLQADVLGTLGQEAEDEQDDERIPQATWQKVVEHRTGLILPAVAAPGLYRRLRASLEARGRSPRSYFWLSALLLACLLLAGGFGVAISSGSRAQHPMLSTTLQASPQTVALGGIITLRGTRFTAHGPVILSRDARIPVEDTGGAQSVQADARGSFSDTVIVDPAWLAGGHTLVALDAQTRRQVSSSIVVIGHNALQGPPRLLLSATSLDFGAGDEATSTSMLLALSNGGGGVVTWQATTAQSWLEISPMNGSIPSGGHLSAMVAVDRARLAPGLYHASLLLLSSTEHISLAIHMGVIPLQPEHEAVLQTSPATLTFSGSARGPGPQVKALLVSNPGVQHLSWGASMTLQNGSDWLWMEQQTGDIEPGGQQQVTVGVNTQNLAPGLYRGEISFVNRGARPIQGSPQDIYVSLTVTPPCVLAFAPGGLSFTGAHNGASPAAQTLRVNVAPGCTTSQNWSAAVRTTSGGGWLHLSQGRAATPTSPLVSVSTAGLGPGVYDGVLTFAVATGPQLVAVTLTVNPIPCAIAEPPMLTLQGTAGQASAVSQTITLTTGGDCPHTLNWTSAVNGASWLSATPVGTLTQPGTASVGMQASLAGLSAGSYTGQVTVSAIDSATGQTVGTVQTSVTLNVQPPCLLQASVPASLAFTASVGSTTTQNAPVTVGISGTCAGNVTITPASDSSWLDAGGALVLASGGTATLTITIDPTLLPAGTSTGTITLTAADGNGAIAGNGQTVSVSVMMQ